MAFSVPAGFQLAYDENGNLTLVPIGSNYLQARSAIDMTGSNPNLEQKVNPFVAKPMKPHQMDTKPIDMEGVNKQLEKSIPFKPVPMKTHQMDTKPIDMNGSNPQLLMKSKQYDMTQPMPLPPVEPPVQPYPDAYPNVPATPFAPLPAAPVAAPAPVDRVPLPQFDPSQGMRGTPATPSTMGYIAGQGQIGAAQGGLNVANANNAELYSMGFPVDPSGVQPDQAQMNQQVYGKPEVLAPNAFARYVGAGVNSLASNPLAIVGGGPGTLLAGTGAAIGAGMGSQAGSDMFPYSNIAPMIGGLVGGVGGAVASSLRLPNTGGVVSQGLRSAEDDVAAQGINSNQIGSRLQGRSIEGTAAPDAYENLQVPQGSPPPPPVTDLPLHVQDQVRKARWFTDPKSYANDPQNNKLMPIPYYADTAHKVQAAIEAQRLTEEWKNWKQAGYLDNPSWSANAARTGDYSEGYYTSPSSTITPEDAAAQFKDLTGVNRMIDARGSAATATKNATTFEPDTGFSGAKQVQATQDDLRDVGPIHDKAKSARALYEHYNDYLNTYDGDNMTDPSKMTKDNMSDYISKLQRDQLIEHNSGEPHGPTDPTGRVEPYRVNDITDYDMSKLKNIRDQLPDESSKWVPAEQKVIDALRNNRDMLSRGQPGDYTHQTAMNNISLESGMGLDRIKQHLGDIQDKLGYFSGEPKDLAEYFYWAKKNLGGGSVGAAKSTPEEVGNYVPTTSLAASYERNLPTMSQKDITEIMRDRYANTNRLQSTPPMSQEDVTREMINRFRNVGVTLPNDVPPPAPVPQQMSPAPKVAIAPPAPPATKPPVPLPPPPTGTAFDNLSADHQRIARLLANGLSSTQIEGRLRMTTDALPEITKIYRTIKANGRTDAILKLNEMLNPFDKADHPAVDSMTPQQRDVAGLLKQGLSIQKIADQLGLSYNQAAGHLSKISDILGTAGHGQTAAALNYPSKIGRRPPQVDPAYTLSVGENDMLNRMRQHQSIETMADQTGQLTGVVKSQLKSALTKQMGKMSDADLEDFIKQWYQKH